MPAGKGTYGSKRGRPPKKNKRKIVISKNTVNKNRANKTVITRKGKMKTKNISKRRGDKLVSKGKATRVRAGVKRKK